MKSNSPGPSLGYIGTYTRNGSKGIYLFRFPADTSEAAQNIPLTPLGLAAETPNPSFLEIDPKRRLLWAINEQDTFEGKPGGGVSAFSVAADGKLNPLNQRNSE